MILHKVYFLLVLIGTLYVDASAQQIRFEHLNSENGLPVNSVTSIAQDDQGFIWMGSMKGLVKFDGYNYKLFQYNYSDSNSIPGHLVIQILPGNKGLIYLSVMEKGLTILDTKTEEFIVTKN